MILRRKDQKQRHNLTRESFNETRRQLTLKGNRLKEIEAELQELKRKIEQKEKENDKRITCSNFILRKFLNDNLSITDLMAALRNNDLALSWDELNNMMVFLKKKVNIKIKGFRNNEPVYGIDQSIPPTKDFFMASDKYVDFVVLADLNIRKDSNYLDIVKKIQAYCLENQINYLLLISFASIIPKYVNLEQSFVY